MQWQREAERKRLRERVCACVCVCLCACVRAVLWSLLSEFQPPRLIDVTQPKNGAGGGRAHPMNSEEKGGLPAGSSKQNQVHPEHFAVSRLSRHRARISRFRVAV